MSLGESQTLRVSESESQNLRVSGSLSFRVPESLRVSECDDDDDDDDDVDDDQGIKGVRGSEDLGVSELQSC